MLKLALLFITCSMAFILPSRAQALQYGPTQTGKIGGRLVRSSFSDPKTFNIIAAEDGSSNDYLGYLFEGLTTPNGETGEIEPQLAQSWEHDPSGKVWIFHLRTDVKWHDGHDFTADDVVFTFNNIYYHDQIITSNRDSLSVEVGGETKFFLVEKLGTYTVRFTLPTTFAPFTYQIGVPILPKHIMQQAVAAPEHFKSFWGINTPPAELIGTGPFMMTEYLPGQKAVYKRNPNYWKHDSAGTALPYLEEIVIVIVKDQNTQQLKFEAGEIDMLSVRNNAYPLLKAKEQKGNYTVMNLGPSFSTLFYTLNLNPRKNKAGKPYVTPYKAAWFQNRTFRQAIAHTVDKESIIENVYSGLAFPQNACLSNASTFFSNQEVPVYDYDLKKARQLLESMGFTDRDGDGIREDDQKRPLEINLIAWTGNNTIEQMLNLLQEDLRSVGIKLNIGYADFNSWLESVQSTLDWEMAVIILGGGSLDPNASKNVWTSKGHMHLFNAQAPAPTFAWEKEIDQLFSQGVQELDRNKRKKIYDRWQQIVAEELPHIYTVNPASIVAFRNKFGNLKPTTLGALHNIEEIFVK